MQFDVALEEELPRQAYFKVGKSINATVLKKEMIDYPADKNEATVRSQPASVRFLISGDCLLDGRDSYFSLKLRTNTFTALLSGGITSIIKKVVLKLPSNSNQVLEEIDGYNTLASLIQMVKYDDDRLASNWYDGVNSLAEHNRSESMKRARRFLNLNEGGFRTFTFQLNLSSILFHEQYLPLALLNGVSVELHFASAQEAFHYNPANEQWDNVFDLVEKMYLKQQQYAALDANGKQTVREQLMDFYQRPECAQQPLQYEVRSFTFHAAAVWMNAEYVKRLVDKATSDGGVNIFFNSYRFNQIPNEGSLILHMNLTEQYQNLKRVFFVTLNKNSVVANNAHSFNLFEHFLKSYKFRIGSRSWQVVSNTEPAYSYTQTLQSLNMLSKPKSNSISFTTYPRTQNIHVFDFEKVHDKTHSGEDTTNGRNLRLEMEFLSTPTKNLVDTNSQPMNDDDGNALVIKRGVNPADCLVYMYQFFTRMINISNKGIAVTE